MPRSNTRLTDGRPASVGVKGRVGQRNAPTILNALYNVAQFWDGRAKTLEEQNRRNAEIILTFFPHGCVRDCKMLDRSTFGRHKYRSVFFPHWWDVPKAATCYAAGRARAEQFWCRCRRGASWYVGGPTCTTRLKAPLSLASGS